MILQDVDDKYDKKNTLPFLANCKTRSQFWHLKNMADRGYGLSLTLKVLSENQWQLHWLSVETESTHFQQAMQLYCRVRKK